MEIILVALGGFWGAAARYAVSAGYEKMGWTRFPWGTLTVNWAGSFLLGLLTGHAVSPNVYLFFGTGFMGAFTTFSTFKVDGVRLVLDRRLKSAVLYLIVSYAGGLLLCCWGFLLGRGG